MSNKVFAGIKLETGIMYYGSGKLSYGAHLTGTLTDAEKSGFSILSTDKDSTDDIRINTFIYVDEKREAIAEVADNVDFKWFYGKEKTPRLPADISDSVRKLILKDVNRTKELFAKEAQLSISILDPDKIDVIMKTLEESKRLDDLFTYAKQLDVELQKDRKASQGVGLSDFVERYAFKEHILLSGPAGSSKTYTADQYLKAHGCHIEFLAGHSGVKYITDSFAA